MSNISKFTKSFEESFNKLVKVEGIYSNFNLDPGGETIYGIARNRNPEWEGWKYIDKIKENNPNYKSILIKDEKLIKLCKDFYYRHYWLKLRLEDINDKNLRYEIFEMSINIGRTLTSYYLQRTVNLLNGFKHKICENLVVDGIIGNKTISAINKIIEHDKSAKFICNYLNIYQGYRYVKLMEKNKELKIYARGWIKRVKVC